MPARSSDTYREIMSQPVIWGTLCLDQAQVGQLRNLKHSSGAAHLLFTGCGSTYYLSLAAAAVARRAGLPALAAPASDLWLSPLDLAPVITQSLLVAVSRSGETTETVNAVEIFRRRGGKGVVVVTCYPDSTLAKKAAVVLSAAAAQEKSLVQTRSFSSMLVLCQALVSALGTAAQLRQGDTLSEAGRRLLANHEAVAAALGRDMSLERFFFLGSGPCYGIACELMLKVKEASLSYSEAYHFLELRHGPKAMVDQQTLVVGLVGDDGAEQEMAVLSDMRAQGARTLTICEAALTPSLPGDAVTLQSGLGVAARLPLYLPLGQLLAYYRAQAKGLDPDHPKNLTAVVTMDIDP